MEKDYKKGGEIAKPTIVEQYPTKNKTNRHGLTILTGMQSLIMTGKAIATVLIDRKMVKRMKMKIWIAVNRCIFLKGTYLVYGTSGRREGCIKSILKRCQNSLVAREAMPMKRKTP